MSRRGSFWRTTAFGITGAVAVLVIGFGLIVANILGAFTGGGPQEDDPEVVAARDVAADELADATLASTVSRGTMIGQPVVSGECSHGQHNWKIQDDFDLACDLVQQEVVLMNDDKSFRADMLALDEKLRAVGWVDAGAFGMRRVIADYWDKLVTPQRPAYSMDDLPGATYAKGDLQLGIRWIERESPDETAAMIPPTTYAVVLTQSTEYFRR